MKFLIPVVESEESDVPDIQGAIELLGQFLHVEVVIRTCIEVSTDHPALVALLEKMDGVTVEREMKAKTVETILCTRCGKHPANETTGVCRYCLATEARNNAVLGKKNETSVHAGQDKLQKAMTSNRKKQDAGIEKVVAMALGKPAPMERPPFVQRLKGRKL